MTPGVRRLVGCLAVVTIGVGCSSAAPAKPGGAAFRARQPVRSVTSVPPSTVPTTGPQVSATVGIALSDCAIGVAPTHVRAEELTLRVANNDGGAA